MQPYSHCNSLHLRPDSRMSSIKHFWPSAAHQLSGLVPSLRTPGLLGRRSSLSQASSALLHRAYRPETVAAAATKQQLISSSSSATTPVQVIEMAAIGIAAACQAFIILKAAMHFCQAQLAGVQAAHEHGQQQEQQQQHYISVHPGWQQQQHPSHSSGFGSSSSSNVLGSVQSLALLVALMCGAALRSLQQQARYEQSAAHTFLGEPRA